jgi:hypothetical protein
MDKKKIKKLWTTTTQLKEMTLNLKKKSAKCVQMDTGQSAQSIVNYVTRNYPKKKRDL